MSLVPIASIWAEDRNGVIGDGQKMLWHVPADFKHFQAATWGCPVIMGRKSWQALPKALPGRLNIVISRQTDFRERGCRCRESPELGLGRTEETSVRDEHDFRKNSSSLAALTANPAVQVADSLERAIHLAEKAISTNLAVPGRKLSGDATKRACSDTGGGDDGFSVETVHLGAAQRIWVIGGGQIYHQAMEIADELVVTYIDLQTTGGTVKAPRIDARLWTPLPAPPSELEWQPVSGDARWKVVTWHRTNSEDVSTGFNGIRG